LRKDERQRKSMIPKKKSPVENRLSRVRRPEEEELYSQRPSRPPASTAKERGESCAHQLGSGAAGRKFRGKECRVLKNLFHGRGLAGAAVFLPKHKTQNPRQIPPNASAGGDRGGERAGVGKRSSTAVQGKGRRVVTFRDGWRTKKNPLSHKLGETWAIVSRRRIQL